MSLRSFLRASRSTRPHIRRLTANTCHRIIPTAPHLHSSQTHPKTTFNQRKSFERSFSTSPLPSTIQDPTRPSLFYHFLPAPSPLSDDSPSYGVSFLEQPPKDAHGPAVIGWLPAVASTEGGEEAGLGDFKENPNFIELVHEVIKKSIEQESSERLKAEAIQLGEGWMHINDDRTVPALGRISSPDDIIASIRVEGGKMLPETYNRMPTYRVCTTDGLTTLSEKLEQKLLDELRRRENC